MTIFNRTFQWSSEARGKAAVHCVIIGFGMQDCEKKRIFDYENPKSEAHELMAKNINAYLVDAADIVLQSRKKPISPGVPDANFGSMPNDGGFLLLTDKEKNDILQKEPEAAKFILPFFSAKEFINNERRWCLWLVEISPMELKTLIEIKKRVGEVKKIRKSSERPTTKRLAAFPTLFGEIRQPKSRYILIPRHSSENRKYIPLGFLTQDNIVADSCLAVPNASLYDFGILSSSMHMAWVRSVCGRLKNDYRYSAGIVYNNFPWPQDLTKRQQQAIEATVQAVLDARAQYPDSSLAEIYDSLTMPPELVRAHKKLDTAVDAAYGRRKFSSDSERLAFLFWLYQQIESPLFAQKNKRRKLAK